MLSILPLFLFGSVLQVFCSITPTPLTDNNNSCPEGYIDQSTELCITDDHCRQCRQISNCKKAAICCNVSNFTLREGLGCLNTRSKVAIEVLHIRNANINGFNISELFLGKLKNLSVTDGSINKIVGEFPKDTEISYLNFSSNNIENIAEKALLNLQNLTIDLSRNNLTVLPKLKAEGNISLDISDNPYMLCSSVQNIIRDRHIFFENENATCLTAQTFHWFNSTERLAISQFIMADELETKCMKNCTCKPLVLEVVMGHSPVVSAEVNCSRAGLTSLPLPLPPYTRKLDISNNNITNLKELRDPSYQYLTSLFADNNQITSIQNLEGTKFMSNFNELSLRNNSIKTFETYLLSNMKFYRTTVARRMYLGQNKLHCECQSTMEFKVWLLTKIEYIPDYSEIMCENMPFKVIEVEQSKLCQGDQDWTDYINYIITAEVLLLIGLIAKVSYDYWVFKTAGYLPWPANKMPKLPCDWLCE